MIGSAIAPARVGQRLPNVQLARAAGDDLELVELERRLVGRRIVLVGLPGAFTPVCTGRHLPELVQQAPRLKASGIDEIVVVAPNSPWVVAAWAERTDPSGRLTFLSDGNLELARRTGMLTRAPNLFLGDCSKRFTMIVDRAVIVKLVVEARIEELSCTRPAHLVG